MATGGDSYLPFRGLSAWFSCSVTPETVKLWEQHGGILANEYDASYLFSDDAFTKDTTRLYEWQKLIVVIQTSFIKEILQKRCQVCEVVLGQHLLHFTVGLNPPTMFRSKLHPPENHPISVAESVYAQYNEVWDKLEEESTAKPLESIIHVDKIQPSSSIAAPFDFVLSQPECRVYRKN